MTQKHTHAIRSAAGFCAALLVLVACSGQREPAQKMLSDIETTVNAAAPDAAKYVPDRLNDVQTKLDDLKTAYTAQDYPGVLARGPAILSEARGLEEAAGARKADITKSLSDQWQTLAGIVPRYESAVQSRLEALGQRKNRRLAKGLDVAAAKGFYDDATGHWSRAQGAFGNGNLDEAVTAGKDARSKLEAAAGALQLTLPGSAD